MGSPDLFKALTGGRKGKAALSSADTKLTPYLAIVSAILYMMAVDGDISERESSQLQSVIGADENTLHRAVAYVESHSVEQFLEAAPSLLDARSRLCLLLNVCDSLMADGKLSEAELGLFDRLLVALGHTKTSFQPYFDVISVKDTTSILGDFSVVPPAGTVTPPMALLVSMLYMMSADGAMAEEEIGRLNAVAAVSPSLLKASLRYVSQVGSPTFLSAAAGLLNEKQRLCILLNACDTMMSDRVVANAEHQLFKRMISAFGLDPKGIGSYLNVIGLKNDVPAEGRAPTPSAAPLPSSRRQGRREEGVVFKRKRTWDEETGDPGKAGKGGHTAASRSVAGNADQLEAVISTTMQDNIDDLRQQFDEGMAVESLRQNARDQGLDTGSKTNQEANGPADLRAVRDAEGAGARREGTQDGPADLRAVRDAEGPLSRRAGANADGPSDLRAARDAEGLGGALRSGGTDGPADMRTARDSDGSVSRKTGSADGPSDMRTARDSDGAVSRKAGSADGPSDLRTARDADGAANRPAGAGDGPADRRTAADAEASTDSKRSTGEGPSDPRAFQDAAKTDGHRYDDATATDPLRHWKDADAPEKKRDLSDAAAQRPANNLIDDRKSFDADPDEDDRGPWLEDEISDRALSISERTQTIENYLEAMLATKSIIAASRLPPLPVVPIERKERFAIPAMPVVEEETKTIEEWMASEPMLFGADAGGPIMSESPAPANKEEARLNQKLRQWSAALLPALFLTYGTTLVGESVAERAFITHQNLATDARTVHQMTTVQQSVYRVAPNAVTLSGETVQAGLAQTAAPAASAAGASAASAAASSVAYAEAGAMVSAAELSDREKADQFLERRKQELVSLSQQHQGASAVAAERQQWFSYAQSIILLGLGMAFWGVLYRSMNMLHASTAAGLVGLLLTANAYWLFVQF